MKIKLVIKIKDKNGNLPIIFDPKCPIFSSALQSPHGQFWSQDKDKEKYKYKTDYKDKRWKWRSPDYLWPKMPPLLLCSAITTWSMAARRSFVFSRWAEMKKSKTLEEKCKSQKGGLFINAFDAYHSLVLPRVEGWANFGKAGPRINHDKNISFLAITPSSPLLYITSPPTLLLPTRSPSLCQKERTSMCWDHQFWA